MNNFSLNDFFAAFRSMRAGRAQVNQGFQGMQSGCCQEQGFMSQQAFDMPDQEVRFDDGCGCAQPMPMQMPQRGCGSRFTQQFSTTNINEGIIDGRGNDIYDAPGDDIYAMGNRGIIDTEGNDIYARNYSINTFNTVNNFYKQESAAPAPSQAPTEEPPGPSAAPAATYNLTPLRNLLTGIEKLQPDGVLSDAELNKAISNPHYADLNGDPTSISSEELAIFNKIKAFNEDKELLSNVMKGDYSNISDSQMAELGELSDAIRRLTQNR